jgi:putative DNA primase/helicase
LLPEEDIIMNPTDGLEHTESGNSPPEELPTTSEAASSDSTSANNPPRSWLDDVLHECGAHQLDEAQPERLEAILRAAAAKVPSTDGIRRAQLRERLMELLARADYKAPAKVVDAAFKEQRSQQAQGQGDGLAFREVEPWPDPVDGEVLAADLTDFIGRAVYTSRESLHAMALWSIHSYGLDLCDISPILAISSPAKRCGKTTTLERLGMITCRPLSCSNLTAAVVFRVLQSHRPTLLIDEGDTFLSKSDELRGVLNGSHRRTSAFVLRCVGDDHEVKQFATWSPKAIALIDRLPATLEDRSILVGLQRKPQKVVLKDLPRREVAAQAARLSRKIQRWVLDHATELQNAPPFTHPRLHDRACDNWGPLMAIARAISAACEARAVEAAVALAAAVDHEEVAHEEQLLRDLKDLFEQSGRDRIPSAEIVQHLVDREDRPWVEWRVGKPITPRQLAAVLRGFGAKPKKLRLGAMTANGYELGDLQEAFKRYLAVQPEHLEQSEQLNMVAESRGSCSVPDVLDVPVVPEPGELAEGAASEGGKDVAA